MVQYAANLAEENHIKPLRQIWLPPLPGLFYLDDLELTWDEKQINYRLVLQMIHKTRDSSRFIWTL